MYREDVIYKKTKYQYGMCNVLFKGLEKDKVYRMRRNGIVYMYIINDKKEVFAEEVINKFTIFKRHKIELIQCNDDKPRTNIFGKYKIIKVKLPSLLDIRLPEEVIYDYYDKFYSKLYIMNRDNKEFLYPYSYIINSLIDKINAIISIKDSFSTNEEYKEFVNTLCTIVSYCSKVISNLYGLYNINKKKTLLSTNTLDNLLHESIKLCNISNDFINEMKDLY